MKLTVKNEQGQVFQYECQEFEGYDVFQEANEQWGELGWETFSVFQGDQVLINVINPNCLDPTPVTVQ